MKFKQNNDKENQLSLIQYIKPSVLIPSTFSNFQSPKISLETEIEDINKQIFKNSKFRENQREVILSALAGNDIFVCMPTGGGKSLTFQLPAVKGSGITIVVMPLISLIQDQVEHLNELNISCRVLSAAKAGILSTELYNQIYRDKSIKIVFVTPEKLSKSDKVNNLMKSLYEENRIDRIAIDEAHCVSQ